MHSETKNVEAIKQLARQDDFGNAVVNPLRTLQESQGYQQTSPERRHVYRNGSRLFLMYDDTFIGGGSTTYVEDTNYGTLLKPGGGDTMRIQAATRVAYAVGYNLIPTMSFEVGGLSPGDAALLGYGTPDIGNYDPAARTWTGTTADGWFIAITEAGAHLLQVAAGTVQDEAPVEFVRGPNQWGRYELWVNWYGVGGCRLEETYTAVDTDPEPNRDHPQRTELLTSVANDTGKGPTTGAGRVTGAIKQASGNTGAELEFGSYSVLVPGDYRPRFKSKGFRFTGTASNATAGTFEVVGAMRLDDALAPGQLQNLTLVSAPSTSSEATVAAMVVEPSETDLVNGDFTTPPELNPLDSEVQTVEDATATGPDRGGATTGINGADAANEVSLPGGYQIGLSVNGSTDASQGPGAAVSQSEVRTERTLPADNYALFYLDASEVGDYTYTIDFAENF